MKCNEVIILLILESCEDSRLTRLLESCKRILNYIYTLLLVHLYKKMHFCTHKNNYACAIKRSYMPSHKCFCVSSNMRAHIHLITYA